MNVMLDIICMDPVALQSTRSKQKLQNEEVLPTAGFDPSTLMIIRKHVLPIKSCALQDKHRLPNQSIMGSSIFASQAFVIRFSHQPLAYAH